MPHHEQWRQQENQENRKCDNDIEVNNGTQGHYCNNVITGRFFSNLMQELFRFTLLQLCASRVVSDQAIF